LTSALAVTLLIIVITASLINYQLPPLFNPVKDTVEDPRILDKYSIGSLRLRNFPAQKISLGEIVNDSLNFQSRSFNFLSDGKKVSGLINLPKTEILNPVVILLRGYVDRSIYSPGVGSQRMGEALASAGIITLAPDFLGYGQSASPSAYPLEERFETYTTAINLIKSVHNLNDSLIMAGLINRAKADKIGIWGHSNGGHIALAVLEITGAGYPTVLWAPVSRSFPYSILFYTDEFDDQGRALRKLVADFESRYDSSQYSISGFWDSIEAPIQLHQGEADWEVPKYWSDEFYQSLNDKNKDIEYFTYPGENHNFQQGAWDSAYTRSLDFYRQHF